MANHEAADHEARVDLPADASVDDLVRLSQERVRSADYDGALEALRRAAERAPTDAGLRALLERTERAAERHSAAVERQRVVAREARELGVLLDDTSLGEARFAKARGRLRRAVAEHGPQALFDELEERLEELLGAGRRERAEEHLRRARGLERAGDLQGAAHQAEQALSLEPDLEAATHLLGRTRSRLDEAEGERRHAVEVDEAARDAERLLHVGELERAEERVGEAIRELGADPAFDALARRIEAARRAKEAQQDEWTERRRREGEALVRQASQRSLAGDFAGAVEALEAAERLHVPLHDLDERLTTARRALERQRREEAEHAARDAALARIRHHLDALRLDDAERAIAEVARRFDVEDRLPPLRSRLEGLREAESAAGVLPAPGDLPKLGLAAQQAIRARESTVAAAYAWHQAFFYPFRGVGVGIVLLIAALSFAATLWHRTAGWGVTLVAVVALGPALLRATLDDLNQPPAPPTLWGHGGARRDVSTLARVVPIALVALFPIALVLAALALGHLPAVAAWPLAAATLALACGLLVPASPVAAAFGAGPAWRLDRHVASLGASATLFVTLVVFAIVSMSLVTRGVVAANVPMLGPALAGLLDGWAVVALPHLVGVAFRANRLAWAERYS